MSQSDLPIKLTDTASPTISEKRHDFNVSIHSREKTDKRPTSKPKYSSPDTAPLVSSKQRFGHYRINRTEPTPDISVRIINSDGSYEVLLPDSSEQKPKPSEKKDEKISWADDWDREEFLAFSSSQNSPMSAQNEQPQFKTSTRLQSNSKSPSRISSDDYSNNSSSVSRYSESNMSEVRQRKVVSNTFLRSPDGNKNPKPNSPRW